ncbi:MAG: septum formation protein Maf [Thiotrichales bacterium]|jgi:septum formation protein|nr:Maf family nucleotide pyrophosphatase [Pseudomonadota bacterium]MCI4411629.1 septum formation protein Maf [Thiotrichales bacterium]
MLYLASASPRRSQLLTQLGIQHVAMASQVPEVRACNETALAYGYRVSFDKAFCVAKQVPTDSWILAADTEVIIEDDTLGQPETERDFLEMMHRLSGNTHAVQTVVTLMHQGHVWQNHQLSLVTFRPLTLDELQSYWQSHEPLGKAGGYAIQGKAQAWIAQFQGSYSGVMGLPLYETEQLFKLAGFAQ